MLAVTFFVLVQATFTVTPSAPPGASDRAQDSRPNVLVIITDDQGYPDLSCHGHPDLPTPELDRLHAQSVRLTDYHVDPTCSPTRAALMTGRWSTRTGVWHTIMGRSLMHPDEQTMAELLRAAGWRTAMFGKWHLGDAFPCRPQDQGFEQGLVHGGGGVGQTPDWYGNDYFDDTYFGFPLGTSALPPGVPRDRIGLPMKVEGYCTDAWFDACKYFILQEESRPFFAYLSTNVAHYPANVAEKYWKPFAERGIPENIARCYGMVANLDENVGRLLRLLDDVGLSENTLVVFTTDNGSAFSKGFPGELRSQKGSEYDGGHRVPFFARWPKGGVGGGRDVDALCAHVDVLPTILELCGVSPAADAPAVDGVSLASALQNKGAAPAGRTLFVHSQRIEHPKKWRKSAVMTRRWRLVNGAELFDVTADPRQEHDLAAEHPEVVGELRGAYEAWWKDLEPSFSIEVAMGLGDPRANPTRLTCHDWRSNKVPWNQGHVANRQVANGEWVVEVVRAGRYRFTLRERPPESAAALAATRGEVWIAGVHESVEVADGAEAVDLVLELPAGRSRLKTALHGTDGKTRGAYFVTVEALSAD